jgi:uncharacterized protein with HEPN domain
MPRDFKVFLKDILQAIARIEEYTRDLSYKDFCENQLVQDGVVRNLEIIGEAVKHLPKDVQKKYSSVEWKKIAGLRDILIHAYFGVDRDIVWDVVSNKIPELKEQISLILKKRKKP